MEQALIQHVRSRIQADVDFLRSQGLLSQPDADEISRRVQNGSGSGSGAVQDLNSRVGGMALSTGQQPPPQDGGMAATAAPHGQARAIWDYRQTQVRLVASGKLASGPPVLCSAARRSWISKGRHHRYHGGRECRLVAWFIKCVSVRRVRCSIALTAALELLADGRSGIFPSNVSPRASAQSLTADCFAYDFELLLSTHATARRANLALERYVAFASATCQLQLTGRLQQLVLARVRRQQRLWSRFNDACIRAASADSATGLRVSTASVVRLEREAAPAAGSAATVRATSTSATSAST